MERWEGDCEFAHKNVILDYALEDGKEGQLQILHENAILDYVLEDGREGQLQMRSRGCYSRVRPGGGERGTIANVREDVILDIVLVEKRKRQLPTFLVCLLRFPLPFLHFLSRVLRFP